MRVCIIGAGLNGITLGRELLKATEELNCKILNFTIFERDSKVGGVWNYDRCVGPQTIYRNLQTNLPKTVMFHPDKPLADSVPLFPCREVVQSYLEDFAVEFDLMQHIKFNTTVQRIKPPFVRYQTELEQCEEQFDWIIVCSGHHDVPYIPDWPGMNSFENEIMHSQNFDDAGYFTEKSVLVVGSKSSGRDIGTQIMDFASHIWVSSRSASYIGPKGSTKVPDISQFSTDSVVFVDGTRCSPDVIVLCTGYNYSYPFIDYPEFQRPSRCIDTLYKQVIYVPEPSLMFMGHQRDGVPMLQSYYQAGLIRRLILSQIAFPSAHEMQQWTRKNNSSHLKQHQLGTQKFEYCRHLASYWTSDFSYIDFCESEYQKATEKRRQFFLS